MSTKAGPPPKVRPVPSSPQSLHWRRPRQETPPAFLPAPEQALSLPPGMMHPLHPLGLYLCGGRAHGVWSSEWSSREWCRLQWSGELGTLRLLTVTCSQEPGVYSALRGRGRCRHSRPLWGQTKASLRLASRRGAVSRLGPRNGHQGTQRLELDRCASGAPLVGPPAPWRWGGLRTLMRPPCTQESGSTKEA